MVLFGLLAAFIALVVLVVFFFWGRVKRTLKGETESQKALLLRADLVVEELDLAIDSGRYLVDHETRRAWFLDPHAIQRAPDGSIAGVVVTNDSCIPQYPGRRQPDLQAMCQELKASNPYLVHTRAMAAIEEMNREGAQSAMGKWIGIAVTICASAVGVMALVILLTSGMMPWSS